MLKYISIRRLTTLAALLATVGLLASCGGEDTAPAESEALTEAAATEATTTADTSPETSTAETETETKKTETEATTAEETAAESETQPTTLPETEPTVEADPPTVENGFTMTEIFRIPPVEKSETVDVTLPDSSTITVKADSTFFGTESAIDRDSHHLGDMLRYTDTRISKIKTAFRVADFDGDRMGEIITFEDGILTIYKRSGRNSCNPVYTQKLDFEGTVIGAGLITDDLYTDILLFDERSAGWLLATGSADGFTYQYIGEYLYRKSDDQLFTGDINADGREELIVINDLTVRTYAYRESQYLPIAATTTTLPFAESGQYIMYAVTDINSDGADDIIGFMKDPAGSKTEKGNDVYGTCAYLSRLDGQFGTYPDEWNNKNINIVHINAEGILPMFVSGGDLTGDGVDDIAVVGTMLDTGREALYSVSFPEEAPAYDYSSHIIKTNDGYIFYTGGLYVDYNTDIYTPTDADHIMAYTSRDGYTWHRNLDAPCFYLGNELKADRVPEDLTPGTYENWWMGNTMEPEVLYVDGVYYMYYQCEYYQYDKSGKLMGADRIGVATSTDGIHFERKTDSPALVSSDLYSCFTHQEVIYVPDDPDGLPFWMYVRYVHNNVETKRVRIRSADPTCFDMDKDYTECSGLNHIGNQMGYISDYDGKGNRLFVRITMETYNGDGKGARWVPSMQFSADGVNWILSDLRMAGANLDIPSEAERHNIFFLGFSTINGTGELAKTEDGSKYEFFFIGGTGKESVAPAIFYSSEGLGRVEFTVDVKA